MGIRIADIVVFSSLPGVLFYQVPDKMEVCAGMRVVVPLRNTLKTGVVVSVYDHEEKENADEVQAIKPISRLLDTIPLVPEELIDLLFWCAQYYHAGLGPCISMAFPPYLRKAKACPLVSDPDTPGSKTSVQYEHTSQQRAAMDEISKAMDMGVYRNIILHGITGSGKTEVYLSGVLKAFSEGKSILYMVPEIALTPQTITMIADRVPFPMALFHSGLSPKARAVEFLRVAQKGVSFVLGTRSAIFAPLKNIGLIVVDEEHDASYKQSDGVRYNARDLALVRAKTNDAVVILGSATPSMETYGRRHTKDVSMVTMPQRTGNAELPDIEVVDMRGRTSIISEELYGAMQETVSMGGQVLLFINRRGFSSAMVCPSCGKVLECPRCDRSLTYHKSIARAICHYCGFFMDVPEICPACGCMDMRPVGAGTERVAEEISINLPQMRVLRMDSDVINTHKRLMNALERIRKTEVDIIVGTQMTVKGHDFPMLNLVGVIFAEQLLYMPDFRAAEKTFQQVVQVAGRAGRQRSGARVIIQTLVPDHPIIRHIAAYDYTSMIRDEVALRDATGFSPAAHMARFIFSSQRKGAAKKAAMMAVSGIKNQKVNVLGPAPAPFAFLRGAERWHVILSSRERAPLHQVVSQMQVVRVPGYVRVRTDIDPYDMF